MTEQYFYSKHVFDFCPAIRFWSLKRKKLLMDFIYSLKGKTGKLLDVGCGGGYLSKFIQNFNPNIDITAIDLSEGGIEKAKERGINALVMDMQNMSFLNSSFDFAIAKGSVHHAENPKKSLEEISRVTKPKGLIYLSLYNKGHFYRKIYHMINLYKMDFKHPWLNDQLSTPIAHFFCYEEIRNLLNKLGFKIIKKDYESMKQIISVVAKKNNKYIKQ